MPAEVKIRKLPDYLAKKFPTRGNYFEFDKETDKGVIINLRKIRQTSGTSVIGSKRTPILVTKLYAKELAEIQETTFKYPVMDSDL